MVADRYAGWALVVVCHDSSDPPRNLTADDGFVTVAANSAPIQIPLSGFQTPPAGTVQTTLGFVAWEGDTGLSGVTAVLSGTVNSTTRSATLSDAVNPASNFFNGAISNLGVNVTNRNPAYVNNFEVDAKLVSASGILPNGATTATLTAKHGRRRLLPAGGHLRHQPVRARDHGQQPSPTSGETDAATFEVRIDDAPSSPTISRRISPPSTPTAENYAAARTGWPPRLHQVLPDRRRRRPADHRRRGVRAICHGHRSERRDRRF